MDFEGASGPAGAAMPLPTPVVDPVVLPSVGQALTVEADTDTVAEPGRDGAADTVEQFIVRAGTDTVAERAGLASEARNTVGESFESVLPVLTEAVPAGAQLEKTAVAESAAPEPESDAQALTPVEPDPARISASSSDGGGVPISSILSRSAEKDGGARTVETPATEVAFAARIRRGGRTDSLVPALRFRDTVAAPQANAESNEARLEPAAAGETEPVRAAPKIEEAAAPLSGALVRPVTAAGEPAETTKASRRAVPGRLASGRADSAGSPEDGTDVWADERVLRQAPVVEAVTPAARQAPRGGDANSAPTAGASTLESAPLAVRATAESDDVRASSAETQPVEVFDAQPVEPVLAEARQTGTPEATVRHVSLEISAPESERRVTVDMVEQDEGLQVAVLSDDRDLTASLRLDLGDLVARLEKSGFDADTWSGDRSAPHDQGRRDAQPESDAGQRDRRRQPAWVNEIQPRRRNQSEESFTWHLQSAAGTT